MNQLEKKRSKNPLFQLGRNYLVEKTKDISTDANFKGVISSTQKNQLKQLRLKTYTFAAITGALAVLTVILPFHYTSFFGVQEIHLFGNTYHFELYYTIYGILMVLPEIWVLNIINIRAVRKLCEILQFPSIEQKDYNEQITLLTEAGLEMPDEHLKLLHINPYIGLSKFSYYTLFIFTKAQAFLSGLVAKIIIRRILGRYALRIVMDLVGVPVYAFWDAWASHKVLREAQIRIIATASSKHFLAQFTPEELQQLSDKLGLLIHFIAQQKRQYSFALYAYIKEIVKVTPQLDLHHDKVVEWKELITNNENSNRLLAKLMIFGFIVDGTLSVKERLTLHKFAKEDWFPMSINDVEELLHHYLEGEKLK